MIYRIWMDMKDFISNKLLKILKINNICLLICNLVQWFIDLINRSINDNFSGLLYKCLDDIPFVFDLEIFWLKLDENNVEDDFAIDEDDNGDVDDADNDDDDDSNPFGWDDKDETVGTEIKI